ncbi:hypothetical protein B0H16DRAFT_1267853, partial [Mycena metata]
DRYHKFLRMTRQWRNLQMLKRAGRGHDPTGRWGRRLANVRYCAPLVHSPARTYPRTG